MRKLTRRYLHTQIDTDLSKKMVFLGGPRQVGKTTLAQSVLAHTNGWYLNWDYDADRDKILSREWPSGKGLLILDEIHK